jgi:hypothetical protein
MASVGRVVERPEAIRNFIEEPTRFPPLHLTIAGLRRIRVGANRQRIVDPKWALPRQAPTLRVLIVQSVCRMNDVQYVRWRILWCKQRRPSICLKCR